MSEPEIRIWRTPDGVWHGAAQLPNGLCVVAEASEGECAQQIARGALQRAQEVAAASGAAAGFGFLKSVARAVTRPARNLARAAKSLARGNVEAAVRHGVRSAMARSPSGMLLGKKGIRMQERYLKKSLPLIQQIAPAAVAIPGLGAIAAPALLSATRLLARAYQGDPRARTALQQIRTAANTPGRAQGQARQLAASLNGVLGMMRQSGALQRAPHGYASSGANGQWVTAQGGQQVFVPHAAAGGPVWDSVVEWATPRRGVRGEAAAVTTREAYRRGMDRLQQLA